MKKPTTTRRTFCLARSLAAMALIVPLWLIATPVRATMPADDRAAAVCRHTATMLQPELKRLGMELGSPIFIRIFKVSNELEVWIQAEDRYKLFKTYEICAFSGDLGPKLREGDRQSPEGFYGVSVSRLNPLSQFHLAFDLGFPNDYDRALGRSGSALMVHGDCVSVGCFAMNDRQMDEIYTLADAALKNGQDAFGVHVFPFRMTQANMALYKRSPWRPFWQNLKEGYDLFEETHIPPLVTVKNNRYVFAPNAEETAQQQAGGRTPSAGRRVQNQHRSSPTTL
ncbi:MAG: L,D-transpeptidase family protein [Thermodesulfobacteriota bacterium]